MYIHIMQGKKEGIKNAFNTEKGSLGKRCHKKIETGLLIVQFVTKTAMILHFILPGYVLFA